MRALAPVDYKKNLTTLRKRSRNRTFSEAALGSCRIGAAVVSGSTGARAGLCRLGAQQAMGAILTKRTRPQPFGQTNPTAAILAKRTQGQPFWPNEPKGSHFGQTNPTAAVWPNEPSGNHFGRTAERTNEHNGQNLKVYNDLLPANGDYDEDAVLASTMRTTSVMTRFN